uniref:Uncharacterized protein n=1 Tax=Candidatus Kentrum sp. FM TaxID=2126340 RepID=A0A450TRW4_9GAMM|nr:MAG: hypothetical protein BECKFM1743A_GA0114220_105731 [Candidatus Kentron sp. FM]VFK18865.1 MAG: hypothetical protein BECKFM1743B_GA0114221_105791 [Candidatus Kentron sp. FM]
MALFDMIDALRDSGLTSILPIPLRVPARPGWDSCSWPGLGQIARWFTPQLAQLSRCNDGYKPACARHAPRIRTRVLDKLVAQSGIFFSGNHLSVEIANRPIKPDL